MWSGRLLRPRAPLAGLQIDVPAELGGDHDLVAERRDAFAEDPLDLMRAVGLGRVEEGDATVEGRPDDVEHLGPAGDRRLVGAAHVLDAEADARDLQLPQPSSRARRRRRIAPRACCLGCGLRARAAEKRHGRDTSHRPQEPTTPCFDLALFSHDAFPSPSPRTGWLRTPIPRHSSRCRARSHAPAPRTRGTPPVCRSCAGP